MKVPETGEYKVKWLENGKYSEDKTYYTNDYQDALDTLRAMENEAIRAGYKIDSQSTNPLQASSKKLTRDDVRVEVWEERDRLHIGIQNKETGDYLASWWDDDAREMFEQGFFKRRPSLEESVLSYAEEMGILQ